MGNDILSIIELLAATSSTNEKLDILKSNADNVVLREVFHMTYNPRFRYNIRIIPDATAQGNAPLDVLLDTLYHELTATVRRGDDASNTLAAIMKQSRSERDLEILRRIINHDLRCGVTGTLANKVWKNLIPKQPQKLATPYSEKALKKITFPAFADVKEDGARNFAEVGGDDITFKTRSGKEYRGLERLKSVMHLFDGYCVDGELVYHDPETGMANRELSNGIANKALNGEISQDEANNLRFHVWDLVALDVYRGFKDSDKLEWMRRRDLEAIINTYPSLRGIVEFVEYREVHSIEDATEFYREQIATGREGIILKNKKSPWHDKRSPDWVKFKEVFSADLRIIGAKEGTGKYEGMLGALHCQSEDGTISVWVGSGFSDKDRKDLWKLVPKWIEDTSTIGEVDFNAITKDKRTEEYSLFLPRWNRIRGDRDTANTFDEIQAQGSRLI